MSKLVAHRPPAGRLGRSKGDSPDTGGSAPGVVCRRMHISIPGNWASNNPVFAISHGSCTAAPSTPSQRSMRSRHAVVPSRFPVQVRRVTQRPPPSEPLPSVRVIQRRVRRRNFPMYTAFPCSEYYSGSAPSAPSASIAPILHRLSRLREAVRISYGWFPRSLLSVRRARHPAVPLRHRHGYAVDIHRGLQAKTPQTLPGVPTRNEGQYAPLTSPHPPG